MTNSVECDNIKLYILRVSFRGKPKAGKGSK